MAYVAVALAAVLIVGAYGLTQLFIQTAPQISVNAGIASNCPTLIPFNAPGFASATKGFVGFDCGFNGGTQRGQDALNVTVIQNPYTPTFTLPSPYAALAITASCTPLLFNLTSGQGFAFPCAGSGTSGWYYHAYYTFVPVAGLPSFQITWSGN